MHTVFWNVKTSPGKAKKQFEEGIGAHKLAAIARQQGRNPIVLQDYNYRANPQEISARTDELDPDILCYSVMSYGVPLLMALSSVDMQRKIPIVIGGPAATIDPVAIAQIYRESTMPVAIVRGDGEDAFKKLLATPCEEWSSIEEVYLVDKGIVKNGVLQHCSLDESPFADLKSSDQRAIAKRAIKTDSIPLEERIAWQRSLLTTQVESRKGCYYQCDFCSTSSMPDHKVRKSSPKRLVAEIEHQARAEGIGFFALTDNIAFDEPEWWAEFATHLQSTGLAPFIQFGGYGTPLMLDKQEWETTMQMLYNVGLRSIILGVQAGSPRILRDIIHRPADDPKHALAIVERYVPLGINIKLDFIIGHPTETADDLRVTAAWVDRIVAAGGEVFVRELNIVSHSGYERRLARNEYSLPEQTPEFDAVAKGILSRNGDDGVYVRRAFMRGIPNKYLIDRHLGIRYPTPLFDRETLERDQAILSTSQMPINLRERYMALYDLVLQK